MRKYVLAAVGAAAAFMFVVAAPMAQAVTITSGPATGLGANPPAVSFTPSVQDVAFTDFYDVNESSVTFTFTALAAALIEGFTISVTSQTPDINSFDFALDNGIAISGYSGVISGPATSTGVIYIDDFTMAANETVNLTFTAADPSALASSATLDLLFDSTEISAVPLPAAMPLMLTAIGGTVALSRRKKKA